MRYKFKFEALRQYRLFKEDMVQKELAEAQRDRDKEIDFLTELMDKRSSAERDLKSEQDKQISGPQIALYDMYLNKLSEDIRVQRIKVKQAEALCAEKMGALLEAMKERKSIEKLKEKGFKDYVENLNQSEQKFLNEIAINRYARTNNGG